MRFLPYLLLFSSLLPADPIDDGAHALAAKIADRLSPREKAHLVVRNISTLPAAEAARAHRLLEAALPRHPRATSVVEVALTFSENAAGYLWVAEIRKGEVEMVAVANQTSQPAAARQLLTKRLLWQQSETLLDFIQEGDRIVLLSPTDVAVIETNKRSDIALDIPRIRDPRGRLETTGNALTAYFPGVTCRGTLQPLHLDCDNTSADFLWNGDKVHFTPARNTIEGIRPEDEYAAACGAMKLAAAKDNIVALASKTGAPIDQAELPGLITALWPSPDGAIAVIHNPNTEQYAAYALSVDCH
jgi:hypothetical protein